MATYGTFIGLNHIINHPMRKLLLVFFACLMALFSSAQPGSNDPSFNTADVGFGRGKGPNGDVNVAVTLLNGKTLIAGEFYMYNGTRVPQLVRLNRDGSIDKTLK